MKFLLLQFVFVFAISAQVTNQQLENNNVWDKQYMTKTSVNICKAL